MLPCQKRQKGEIIPAQPVIMCPVSTSVNLLSLHRDKESFYRSSVTIPSCLWTTISDLIILTLLGTYHQHIHQPAYIYITIHYPTYIIHHLSYLIIYLNVNPCSTRTLSQRRCEHTTPWTLFISTTWHLPAAARAYISYVGCVRVRMSVCYEGVWLPGHMLWLQLLVILCSFPGCTKTDRIAFLGNTPL